MAFVTKFVARRVVGKGKKKKKYEKSIYVFELRKYYDEKKMTL